jgi:3-methyladenine DNA glycosylase/8-oxoguanine DNA glycosylase
VVDLTIAGRGSVARPRVAIEVAHRGTLSAGERSAIRSRVRRMFRLDEDLAPFHRLCRRFGGRWRVAERGLGRLLRSPSVFEDAVKTLCTTNVQWGGTRAMVARLVDALGEPGPASGGEARNAFPTPEAIAGAADRTLEQARLGYRAPYVRELAERVAAGVVDLEALLDAGLPAEEVRRRLMDLKGFGPYATATMLMLLGRYERVAVDSVYRDFVTRRYFPSREPSADELESVYAEWGEWQYLAYWFDLWQGLEEEL